MKKLHLFVLAMIFATTAMAQSVPTHEMYVDDGNPVDATIVAFLDKWEPGKPWNGDDNYVDENFWISRVPLKNRFRPGDQANDALNDSNNKNFCWCAPTGEMTKKWGALPRYNFDGDNFNMWQYVDIHSNWTNGWWRVPGAFNDVAHKNGVKTGCTYFIDWGAAVNNMEEPGKTLFDLAETGSNSYGDKYKYSRKLIQFLKYYGIDGLAMNPEGYWGFNVYNRFIPFLAECHKIAKELNHPFHVDWYAFVTNTGGLNDNSCKLDANNQNWFHHTSTDQPVTDVFFLNYNWTEGGLATSAKTAKNLGRSTFDVYAGFDMQGRGYGKTGNAGWKALMNQPVSIVVWGAHDRNQLYISSTEGGQSDYAVQNEYQKKQEMLFSGGNRNVLNMPALWDGETTSTFSDLKKWHGYATAVIERSTLDELPFVTRFNLGNGRFFKKEGVTTWDHKWYNYGMQDLLPTWRWWVDKGDGKTVPADAVNLDFTFDDAWFAGSCLKIHGATKRSDVRLFATKWKVANGDDEFRIVFKPNTSKSNLKLMVAKEDGEKNFVYVPLPAKAEPDAWNAVVIKASEAGLKAGDVIGCVGLSVENTDKNYEVLLGEFAFVPASFNERPETPTITHAEVMKRYYNRADIKVVFNMPTPSKRKAEYEGCPVYNEEVGTWYYEIYVKQEGQETLLTTTTSWAAYVVDATLIPKVDKLQIGVRAVGKDGRAMSDIVWSKEIEEPLTMIETLTVDKSVIKPNEDFTIGFEDPNHPVSDIKIKNALTDEIVTSSNGVLTMTASLPAVGSYDVEVTTNGNTIMNRSLILVTPETTGRLPQINSITSDITLVDAVDKKTVNFTADINDGTSYDNAPCTVSQSLYMSEPYQFTVDAAVMSEYTNTSFALWFKVEKFEHASLGTLLMTKVNRNYNNTWTENVWGEMWTAIRPKGYAKSNNIGRDNAENELSLCTDAPPAGTSNYEHNNDVDILSEGYSLMPGVWYHVCAVKSGRNLKLYLNGKVIAEGQSRGSGPKNWRGAKFYVGGSMTNLASFTGWVDEVQIWSKALTADEVKKSMKGYHTAPTNLEGYFTFEETKTDSIGIYFPNYGKGKELVEGGYMTIGKEENGKTTDYRQNQLTTALGVPMLEGVYPIKYESSKWMLEGARINSSTATSAEASYIKGEGVYPVTLISTNSWGSATKTITDYITVTIPAQPDEDEEENGGDNGNGDGDGEGGSDGGEDGDKDEEGDDGENSIERVAEEAGYMIYPKPFEKSANLLFAQDGLFEVVVFASDGKFVANELFETRAGEVREISLANHATGEYVVVIMNNGKAIRSFKIVVK